MATNIQHFEQLIGQLMSSDNNVRGAAETMFNESKKSPELLATSLVQLIRTSQHQEIRSLCAILLRRILSKDTDSLWLLLSPQTQETVKAQLLENIETEKNDSVRSSVGDVVAHLGSLILEKGGQWNELLPFLFKCTKSQNESHRESALSIFASLANYVGEKLRGYFNVLKDVLSLDLMIQAIV